MDRRGSVATEFAFILPIFLCVMFGTVSLASVVATNMAVQQLVAEGARASVAGLTDTERNTLARTVITNTTPSYPYLDPTRMTVSTTAIAGSPAGFSVTISYDLSHSLAYSLAGLVPMPRSTVTRTATVQNGGF